MDEKRPSRVVQPVRRATEIRTIILLPVLLLLLTVTVVFWVVYLATGSLGLSHFVSRTLGVRSLLNAIFLVVGVGGGLSVLLGIALAYFITRAQPGAEGPSASGRD